MSRGRFRVAYDAATAGNATLTIQPSTGMSARVVMGQIALTTDATVANRRALFTIKDADGNVIIDIHAGAVTTASLSDQHSEFMQGVFRETSFIDGALQVPIPSECLIPFGGSLEITIQNGVAGDTFVSNFLLKEF